MKCPHCNNGKILLLISEVDCEECGGTGDLKSDEVPNLIAINDQGNSFKDQWISALKGGSFKNPCAEIVLDEKYEVSLDVAEKVARPIGVQLNEIEITRSLKHVKTCQEEMKKAILTLNERGIDIREIGKRTGIGVYTLYKIKNEPT
jgi:hypothetical protein